MTLNSCRKEFAVCVLILIVAFGSAKTWAAQDSSGGNIEFTLNLVTVQSVNAIASSAGGNSPRYAFVKADSEFGSIQVRTAGSVDDGGVGPGGGWNRIHNN